MQYIHRTLEKEFIKANSFFKVILVTGARQVGKTTMLKHLAETIGKRTYITLDDITVCDLARRDPKLFFQKYKPPVIIDEIQKAPELFPEIKRLCDLNEETGQFWLTGSKQFGMMQRVKESLAGRIGILTLYGLSNQEKCGEEYDKQCDYSLESLQKRSHTADYKYVFEQIIKGGMPQAQNADFELRSEYFSSYIDTYLMRDVAEDGAVSDLMHFKQFLMASASLVGQQVNYQKLSEVVGVSQPTIKNWLSVLEGLNIVYLLKPYSNNMLKRLAKTPKLYFLDTGLAAYLAKWPSAETLMSGPANGAFFENYVVSEFIKNMPKLSNISYFRNQNAKEIDLIYELNGKLHPFEIKLSATPNIREVKKFSELNVGDVSISYGGIICMSEELLPIDEKNNIIPCGIL